MFPTVLLRHTLPDGTHHFDWLFARCTMEEAESDPDRRDAFTLRLHHRPDTIPPGGTTEAQQLPDHRRRYLMHEGDVPPETPGGPPRGRVERIAAGLWRPTDADQPLTDFVVAFAGAVPSRWTFQARSLMRL